VYYSDSVGAQEDYTMFNGNFDKLLIEETQIQKDINERLAKLASYIEKKYNKKMSADEIAIMINYDSILFKESRLIDHLYNNYFELKEALDTVDDILSAQYTKSQNIN
jgi:hypothetical protein